MRLQVRYSIIIVTLTVCVVLIMSALLMVQFRSSSARVQDVSAAALQQTLVSQVIERGAVMADYLAKDLEEPLMRLDMLKMKRLLETASANKDVLYVVVHDAEGRIVHDGSLVIETYGRPLAAILPAAERASGSEDLRYIADGLEVARSIVVGQRYLGGVRIGLSLESVSGESAAMREALGDLIGRGLRTNLTSVLLIMLFLIVAGIVVAMLVARSLVMPIRRLAAYASQIGRGDYELPLDVKRKDELGELAVSLTEMSSNLKSSASEVRYLAYHDSLTSLPNRTHLKRSLQHAVSRAERQKTIVALLFIDLDDFKRVNDTLGHDAGDALLQEFARRLQDSLRGQDKIELADLDIGENELGSEWIARLGGDEFTVVLEDLQHADDAGRVAVRILETLRRPFILSGQEVVVGGSIGITTFPDDALDVDSMLRNADVAMYQAKARGKNHFQYYNDSMIRMATERLSLESDLRHAIEYDQMRLMYQPIVRTGTGEVIGIEALARWQHPALGSVAPDLFVPLAEEIGFIRELDEWTCDTACRDIAALHDQGFNTLCVAMNIKSVHFLDTSVPDLIESAAKRHGVDPRFLRVELTERTLMRNVSRAMETLEALRNLGVSTWIDDFGSGNSPLTYLTTLPVDGLKIDGAFVNDINHEEQHRTIVTTIVAMGHSLGLSVIAEAVENQKQLAILRAAQCDALQGYLFARPMLIADLMEFLRRNGTGGSTASDGAKGRSVHILKFRN